MLFSTACYYQEFALIEMNTISKGELCINIKKNNNGIFTMYFEFV